MADTDLDRLLEHPAVRRAVDFIRAHDETTLGHQMALTAIPAPPFGESVRGDAMAELLSDAGVADVATDAEGNVHGVVPGTLDAPELVVAAHLDTVFPADTPLHVSRDGDLLRGPGISDDARGLAVLLTLASAFGDASLGTLRPLRFVATVGEEGPGNLRGVRHLFGPAGAARRAGAFVSIDGGGLDEIVVRGVGSRRFRVTVRGTGGHSWLDWGIANPVHALGAAIGVVSGLGLPQEPATTLTVARWGGGTAVNAIPREAWIEVDTRSEAESRLETLEEGLREAVRAAVEEENGRARGEGLVAEVSSMGIRPAGTTADTDPLVAAAMAATRRVGGIPRFVSSSTDSNVPMSVGIPAVTLGGGGAAGNIHTPDEWYHNGSGVDGILRALYTVLLWTGVAE
ncbi:MAG: M20/M25/M40 family metallo-hydrolase [Gemmatimonadota bacterium]|nr:M20/M25/M40 family metallo-hydrolase [Gemmatimonadota bacterium]MDH5758732.1 M20/M25/M40 family metallo-hydrolase [Gemmatimonadota bacterium]